MKLLVVFIISISSAFGMSDIDKVIFVNRLYNEIPYQSDIGDTWSTPKETLENNYADCEDYVFIKYFKLIEMGIDDADLEIVFFHVSGGNEGHAMLKYRDVFLDNNTDLLLTQEDVKGRYMPFIGFNANNYFVYKGWGYSVQKEYTKENKWTRFYDKVNREET